MISNWRLTNALTNLSQLSLHFSPPRLERTRLAWWTSAAEDTEWNDDDDVASSDTGSAWWTSAAEDTHWNDDDDVASSHTGSAWCTSAVTTDWNEQGSGTCTHFDRVVASHRRSGPGSSTANSRHRTMPNCKTNANYNISTPHRNAVTEITITVYFIPLTPTVAIWVQL